MRPFALQQEGRDQDPRFPLPRHSQAMSSFLPFLRRTLFGSDDCKVLNNEIDLLITVSPVSAQWTGTRMDTSQR